MESDEYFEPEKAGELTKIRDETRRENPKRRLTYDCLNAVLGKGLKIRCKCGHPLKTTSLLPILRGRSSRICQLCKDFDGEMDED